MASHAEHDVRLTEPEALSPAARKLVLPMFVIGALALAAALGIATGGGEMRRFWFAYLTNYAFVLSIALGGLAFVLVQHLTRAGWSVNLRRVGEAMSATLPLLALLAIPLLVPVFARHGELYRWAEPPDKLHGLVAEKTAALNPLAFAIRLAIYFAVLCGIAIWYWRQSVRQDKSGAVELTSRMQTLSAPATLLWVLTATFASFDLVMSLDPEWFSTIFGVYFLSGCVLAGFSTLILLLVGLQHRGYLTQSITTEHYHDLGKWLFGFVFFWGYIAFSQYMLLWYSSIPEELGWFARRGATTVPKDMSGWTLFSIILLVGQLIIPFAGLLSRHVKRNRPALVFWAGWVLAFHWVDCYWMVMPEMGSVPKAGLPEALCFIGLAALFFGEWLRRLSGVAIRPVHDPRVGESVAFENV